MITSATQLFVIEIRYFELPQIIVHIYSIWKIEMMLLLFHEHYSTRSTIKFNLLYLHTKTNLLRNNYCCIGNAFCP